MCKNHIHGISYNLCPPVSWLNYVFIVIYSKTVVYVFVGSNQTIESRTGWCTTWTIVKCALTDCAKLIFNSLPLGNWDYYRVTLTYLYISSLVLHQNYPILLLFSRSKKNRFWGNCVLPLQYWACTLYKKMFSITSEIALTILFTSDFDLISL